MKSLLHTAGLHVDPNFPFLAANPQRFVVPYGSPDDAKPVKILHVRTAHHIPFIPQPQHVTTCMCEMALTGVHTCDLLYTSGGDHTVFTLHYEGEKRMEWENITMP